MLTHKMTYALESKMFRPITGELFSNISSFFNHYRFIDICILLYRNILFIELYILFIEFVHQSLYAKQMKSHMQSVVCVCVCVYFRNALKMIITKK